MADESPLLDLPVPDDLLKTAIARTKVDRSVAEDALMPGVGSGDPPPILEILRRAGPAGLLLMSAAAFLPTTIEAGIGILAPDIQRTFGLSDAGIGAVGFIATASFFGLGIPVALWADRGSRVRVATITLAVWVVAVLLMAMSPTVWLFALFAVLAGFGRASPNSVHLSYLADAYPVEGRARVFALHRGHDPMASTLGAALMGGIAGLAGGGDAWRWAFVVALLAIPVIAGLSRLPEPRKGRHEQAHVLADSTPGRTDGDGDADAPKILLGTAAQRLMRIRSIYFQFVAMAVLGFAAVGIPLFGSLYLERVWDLGPGQRGLVFAIIGAAAFLGIPIAGYVGDRLYRRGPNLLLLLAGISLTLFGVIFSSSLYLPRLWMVVVGWFLAQACIAPLATAITQTVSVTAPPAMRSLTFALFGFFVLVFGGFAGSVILGAISDAMGETFALTLMAPVTITGGLLLAAGSRHVKADMTLVIEEILDEHEEQIRRASGGDIQALQVHNLDFAYGTHQVLFDVDLEVDEGEVVALLGTNGAGKSTLLRAVAGLDHPLRGTIRIFGIKTTYLEAEQIMGMGVSLLSGGRMTFPSLTVAENLRVGAFGLADGKQAAAGIERVYETFPVLAERRNQQAGTLSGGEQQMLALGRALIHRPRLLLIDELTLGLAPKVVEGLLDIVRAINEQGTTVLLVEQSVNLALSLAERCYFLERGEVRFEGSTAELLRRDDLLRPIFLGAANL